MEEVQLTQHFTLNEFCKPSITIDGTIDNTPRGRDVVNLYALCVNVLEPIRGWVQMPMIINSGFRSLESNRACGGVPNSQHMSGMAADFTFTDRRVLEKVAYYLMSDECPIDFDQCIYYRSRMFIHISYNSNTEYNRKQGIIRR